MEKITDETWRYNDQERVMMRQAGYSIASPKRETTISTHVDAARFQMNKTMKITHRDGRITDGNGDPWKNYGLPDPSGLPRIDLTDSISS